MLCPTLTGRRFTNLRGSMDDNKRIIEDFAITVALFVIVVALVCLTSCRHTNAIVAQSNFDSVWVQLRERMSWELDTVYFRIPLVKESQRVHRDSSRLENDFALSVAAIMPNGKLFHSLETKPRLIFTTFKRPILQRDSIIYRNFRSVEIKEVNVLTKMQKFAITGFWSIIGAIGLFLIGKLWSIWKKIKPF